MRKIEPGKYQHYKGKFYEVIGIAKFGKNALWVRPKKMFLGKVEFSGKKVFCFRYFG